jgi:hypothetical protein
VLFKINISEESKWEKCTISEVEGERKSSVIETKLEQNFKMKGGVNIDSQYAR